MHNLGRLGEDLAAQYLSLQKGWEILEKRVRFREGELDLIAVTPKGDLRFIEVKMRRSQKFGGVVESLTTQKIQRLRRAIYRWRIVRNDFRKGLLIFLGIFFDDQGGLTIDEFPIE